MISCHSGSFRKLVFTIFVWIDIVRRHLNRFQRKNNVVSPNLREFSTDSKPSFVRNLTITRFSIAHVISSIDMAVQASRMELRGEGHVNPRPFPTLQYTSR
jgi:hypothetical protein